MRKLLAAALIWLSLSVGALAQTTIVALNPTTWTSLGAGPMLLSTDSTIIYEISTATPTYTPSTIGYAVGGQFGGIPQYIQSTVVVWAKLAPGFLQGNAIATPVTAGGGGGGNVAITSPVDGSGNVEINCEVGCSGGGGGSVTQGTTPWITSNDPCASNTKLFADFEGTTSGGSIITLASGKKNYICGLTIVTSAAANISLIEGTGSGVCTGGTTAGVYLNTGVTAANGASFAANGGVARGDGASTLAANATVSQNICVLFTTTNSPQVNVHVAYVQQ